MGALHLGAMGWRAAGTTGLGLAALGLALAVPRASGADEALLASRVPLPPDTARIVEGPTEESPDGPTLPPLVVRNANTNAEARIRLYDAAGRVDDAGVAAFREVAGEADKPAPLKARVLQLVVKAAYELGASTVVLVSSYRPKDRRGRGGYHTTGDAVDFQLLGVPARKLASHVRSFARAGVGVYTHPRTQFVHVDDREQSYHWLDASPPGRTWKEAQLGDPKREARDAAWTPSADLPAPGVAGPPRAPGHLLP